MRATDEYLRCNWRRERMLPSRVFVWLVTELSLLLAESVSVLCITAVPESAVAVIEVIAGCQNRQSKRVWASLECQNRLPKRAWVKLVAKIGYPTEREWVWKTKIGFPMRCEWVWETKIGVPSEFSDVGSQNLLPTVCGESVNCQNRRFKCFLVYECWWLCWVGKKSYDWQLQMSELAEFYRSLLTCRSSMQFTVEIKLEFTCISLWIWGVGISVISTSVRVRSSQDRRIRLGIYKLLLAWVIEVQNRSSIWQVCFLKVVFRWFSKEFPNQTSVPQSPKHSFLSPSHTRTHDKTFTSQCKMCREHNK